MPLPLSSIFPVLSTPSALARTETSIPDDDTAPILSHDVSVTTSATAPAWGPSMLYSKLNEPPDTPTFTIGLSTLKEDVTGVSSPFSLHERMRKGTTTAAIILINGYDFILSKFNVRYKLFTNECNLEVIHIKGRPAA